LKGKVKKKGKVRIQGKFVLASQNGIKRERKGEKVKFRLGEVGAVRRITEVASCLKARRQTRTRFKPDHPNQKRGPHGQDQRQALLGRRKETGPHLPENGGRGKTRGEKHHVNRKVGILSAKRELEKSGGLLREGREKS